MKRQVEGVNVRCALYGLFQLSLKLMARTCFNDNTFGGIVELNRVIKQATLKANSSETAGNQIVKYEWVHSALPEQFKDGIKQSLM